MRRVLARPYRCHPSAAIEVSPATADPPSPIYARAPCLYLNSCPSKGTRTVLHVSTSTAVRARGQEPCSMSLPQQLSEQGARTVLANGAMKADRKPPFYRISFFFLADVFFLFYTSFFLCIVVNGTFPFKIM